MDATAAVRPAEAADWPCIASLLSAAGLPIDDLRPEAVAGFRVVTDGARVVGAVAVEEHGEHGLLRSLVVDPDWRGRGVGRALIAAAEAGAASARLDSLTLLTRTAGPLFRALGYLDIPRTEAPAHLHASAEFTHLCPGDSECLTKKLKI